MKSIIMALLIIIAAGAAFAYSQGYFGTETEEGMNADAGLNLSVDGVSGFGEE